MIQPSFHNPRFVIQRFIRASIRTVALMTLVMITLLFTSGISMADETVGGSANEVDAILDYTQRIIGGRPATVAEWPSVVALVSPGNFAAVDRQFCGGTVVANRWVMTAAHCIYDSFDNIISSTSVRIIEGVSNLRLEPIPEEHVVVNIIPHPLYDNAVRASYNDIALLELATELDAPAVPLFVGDSESLVGQNGWITGWGAISFASEATAVYPDDLRAASVPFVSRDVCNAPTSYNGYVVGFLTCAGFPTGGVDTCVGDSGGPLFGEVDGVMQQIGITSFGQGCAQPDFYGIYTHVPSYIPWLADYIPVPDQPNPPSGNNVPRANNQPVTDSSDAGATLAALWLLAFIVLKSVFLTGCAGSNAAATTSTTAQKSAVKGDTEVQSMTEGSEEQNEEQNEEERNENDARPGIRVGDDNVRIGQARDVVMASMQSAGLDNFDCQAERVAMVGSKRAFLLERCSRNLASSDWPASSENVADNGVLSTADMSAESLVVYFIDQQLVRLDVAVTGDEDDTVAMLDKHFARLDDVWTQGPDQVRRQQSSVQLIDAEVASRIPKLFK